MSCTSDLRAVAGSTMRAGTATNELLRASGTDRALGLLAEFRDELETGFVAPKALDWVRTEESRKDRSLTEWTDTSDDSEITGLVRTYSGQFTSQSARQPDSVIETTAEPEASEPSASARLEHLRFSHKDNIGVEGFPLSVGNPALRDNRSDVTSPLLVAIESAGGDIVGCNHMAEFAMSPTGHNQWLGDGVNPCNPNFLSGGSSSGSAITVSSKVCDISLGTDTGGSVRLPAAFCGVVGYKPTNGLFSHTGLLPLSETLDTIGLLGSDAELLRRTAEVLFDDQAVIDDAARAQLDGKMEIDDHSIAHIPQRRVVSDCDLAVSSAYSTAVNALGRLDVAGVDCGETALKRNSVVIVSVEAARNVGRTIAWDWDKVGDQVLSRVIRGTAISAVEYADALEQRRPACRRYLHDVFRSSRFLLTPTSPILAPARSDGSDLAGSRARKDYMRASRYTRTINYLGLPAVTIPLPEAEHSLRPGLQIIGRPFDDRALLDLAAKLTAAVN